MQRFNEITGEIHKATDAAERSKLQQQLLAGGWLLGLLTRPAAEHFQAESEVASAMIEERIAARKEARENKDYAGR